MSSTPSDAERTFHQHPLASLLRLQNLSEYELRLLALEQLSGIGGDLFFANAHRIIVTGPNKLREAGRTIAATCGRGCPSSPRAMTAEGQVA